MVLGAGGMLGHDLVAAAPRQATVHPFTHAELDVTDSTALASRVRDLKPAVIVNAAAYTAVDRAEAEQETAFRINAEAVGQLGQIAHQAGVSVVHFSTDYVFDGAGSEPYRETSPTAPINAYGASKLAGEEALTAANPDSLIVRTQWLFGFHGKSFPRTMWDRARGGAVTKVVHDQTGCPTYTPDLAHATWQLTQLGTRGIVHVTNAGVATWFEVAARIFAHAGRLDLLTPCLTADYPTPARRPRYSVLDTSRLKRTTGAALRPWTAAVDHFLASLAPAT